MRIKNLKDHRSVILPAEVSFNGFTEFKELYGSWRNHHFEGFYLFPDNSVLCTLPSYRRPEVRHGVSGQTDASVELILSSDLRSREWAWPDGKPLVKTRMQTTDTQDGGVGLTTHSSLDTVSWWIDHELGIALPYSLTHKYARACSSIRYPDYTDKTKLPLSGNRVHRMQLNPEAVSRIDVEHMVEMMREAESFGSALLATADEPTQRALHSTANFSHAITYLTRALNNSLWAVGSSELDFAQLSVDQYKDKSYTQDSEFEWQRINREALLTGLTLIPAIKTESDIGPCTAVWFAVMQRMAEALGQNIDALHRTLAHAFVNLDATEIDQSFTHLIKRK